MSQQQGKLIVRRKAQKAGKDAPISIFLDGVEIGSVANGSEKTFDYQPGIHYIFSQIVNVNSSPILPVSFNAPPDKTIEIDIDIVFSNAIFTFTCRFRDSSFLIQDAELPTDALKSKLLLLETQRENLETKIAKPNMSTGMAFVWLIFIFLLSGVCSWGFGLNTRPDIGSGMAVMLMGLVVFGSYFFIVANNKATLENQMGVIKNTISQIKIHLEKKSGSFQNSSISETKKTIVSDVESSTTQNLETELRRIKKLLDDELITDDEYQALRKKVMKSV